MTFRVALAGNPNCGKTTLFNNLTGANQHVGNWPGVTVEKKEGRLKGDGDVVITDLPGIYSLSPYTLEEVVARNYLLDERPDAVLNIVDGTNLERNLYLTTQLIELGIPVIVAVNMLDLLEKTGGSVDVDALSRALGCPVVQMSALKGVGVEAAALQVAAIARKGCAPVRRHGFAPDIEEALDAIGLLLGKAVPDDARRFYAVRVFERDRDMAARIPLPDVEGIIEPIEGEHDDDAESLIVNERYRYISSIIDGCCTAAVRKEAVSDRIDKVVTNRWLALPIFIAVMFLVYFISVTSVGKIASDWANEGVFGEGWFLGPGQDGYALASDDYRAAQSGIEAFAAAAQAAGLDPASETFVQDATDAGIVATYDTYDEDTGENIVSTVDAASYAGDVEVQEPDPAGYGLWIPGVPTLVANGLSAIDCDSQIQSLIIDGIIAGVGAVIGFVPQLMVLFILLAFLEGCGYMSRIAFILDRIFRRFGLSGKSFIPMLISTGCGVPGIMASRTIENENDRRMTVMTTTFMPCSAKLPIIALFAGAVFGGAWWVAPSAYFLGIASILCSGIILKKTRSFAGDAAPFVMELPAYHRPTVGSLLHSMWDRTAAFLKKAGTIILLAAIVIWFISGYGFENGVFGPVEDPNLSILAVMGSAVAWVFAPLGWADWRAVSATFTGLIAKENVVSTVGILYAGGDGWYANVQAAFTPLAGYSLLAFNLLCAPCFAAMGAIRREMGSARWFWAAVGYECGFAYCVALVIYQVGSLISGGVSFGPWGAVALALIAGFLYLMIRPQKKSNVPSAPRLAVNVAQDVR